MANIIFQTVKGDYDQIDEIKEIYEEAFPPEERMHTIDDLLVLTKENENIKIISVVEDDAVVGFLVIIEKKEYVYGLYLAVKNELRCNGYGTKIMKALFEKCSGRTLLFSIETPEESAPNYQQRVKREALYTRLGCVRAGYDKNVKGINYTFMCSKMSDNVRDFIDDFLKIFDEVSAAFR